MFRPAAVQRIIDNFCCPKCRSRACYSEQVWIGSGVPVLGRVFGRADNRYLAVSCGLCGYSELYNLKIIVQQHEVAQQHETDATLSKPATAAPPQLCSSGSD